MRAWALLLVLLCAATVLTATAFSHGKRAHTKLGVKAARIVKRASPPASRTAAAQLPSPQSALPAERPAALDTTPPNTTIGSGPSGTISSTKATIGFSSSEAGSTFECSLDTPTWNLCASPKTYNALGLGAHTFAVRATDATGNTDPSPASRSWTVGTLPDTTPPNTSISSGPLNTTTSTSASFGFSSSESDSTFLCSLDSGAPSSCTSPVSYSSLSLGPHSFSVAATDAAGNTDPAPSERTWTVIDPESPAECTTTLPPGANASDAVANAEGGAVICLSNGSYSLDVTEANKSSMVTIKPAPGAAPSLDYSLLNQATNLRFQELKFTGGIEALGPASKLQFIDNEFAGPFGIHANGQQLSAGSEVTDVLIEGNYLHDLDYSGSQESANGYGITGSNGVSRFTITSNTIKSPASDYIQSASPVDWVVDHNTFLGPSLLGAHEDHQDLWQVFGGGEGLTFTNNVARNTETQESLLFQEGSFSNVDIENNLFDHDSLGYTCQIYQSSGLVFRNNTIVGSHWGCLFRDLASEPPGSGYEVDHNVFAGTEASFDFSEEGRAGDWGTYDYNVSSDSSAEGLHSVRNWSPSWSDTTNYSPLGLPFAAGFSP